MLIWHTSFTQIAHQFFSVYEALPAEKLVKACFSDSKDQESSFHHCGGPVRLVQACLCAGKT